MQADLFNLSMSNSFERQAFERSFFEKKFTLRMDQFLGLGLVSIVFFVLVFAWGVDHGKADSRRDFMLHAQKASTSPSIEKSVAANPDLTSVDQVSVVPPAGSVSIELAVDTRSHGEPVASVQPSTKDPSDTPTSSGSKYTIAHITYVKKDQAMHEIKRIKSKGYASFLVSSGKFFQICVSGFDSRKTANDAIKSLRLKGVVSPDSYIRNMPTGH